MASLGGSELNRIRKKINLLRPRDAVRKQKKIKKYLQYLFSPALSQFKKYHPSGKMKFNNLGIFQSLKMHTTLKKIISISLKLNFTPNTLGCKRLNMFTTRHRKL